MCADKHDIYQNVTDIILKQLEQGTRPWQQPWKGLNHLQLPVNYSTGKHYRGINILLLLSAGLERGFTTNQFATFDQWKQQKECIRKGEKSSIIVKYDMFEKEVDGEIVELPFLKTYNVFNRCQLQSYQYDSENQPERRNLVERLDRVDTYISNIGASISHDGGYRAFYRPSSDSIHMPQPEEFAGTETQSPTEAYYSTLLHETVHWTGHEKRLNRSLKTRSAKSSYAMEELVAELGAAFLDAKLEIADAPRPDHADYLNSWLSIIKEDKKAIFTAASEASKACDYLDGLQVPKS